MRDSIFTISLDFELHWGGFEKWPAENYKRYFLNTRTVIPEMLRLFERYEVHTTWATVGMLFHSLRNSLLDVAPSLKPTYNVSALSAYDYIQQEGIGVSEKDDPLHFAQSLVQLIAESSLQELGSHTFAHYYCNEPGQTLDQFRADLRSAQSSAKAYGKLLRSLVFPRNQFNDEYLKVCFQEGFIAVRDNPSDWFWNIQSTQHESMWKRFNRGVDAYFPIGKKNSYKVGSLQFSPGLPICIPASRLLRPYRPKELFLNNMKIVRIKNEMEQAAIKGEVYHLWWHPHNFGHYPKESIEGLKRILDHFSYCRDKYGMTSLSMGELAELVIERQAAL